MGLSQVSAKQVVIAAESEVAPRSADLSVLGLRAWASVTAP